MNKIKLFAIFLLLSIFLALSGYAEFFDSGLDKRKLECTDPFIKHKTCTSTCDTGLVTQASCTAPCDAQLKEDIVEYNNCLAGNTKTCITNTCQITVTSNFDGVSADGVSNITFKAEVSGSYDDFGIDVQSKTGEGLRGNTKKVSKKEIIFTPKEADKDKNYLTPQNAEAVGWCTPKKAECETEAPEKITSKKDFTIEQPPLFFVHGIWSDAETWAKDYERAKEDKWQFGNITYLTQNNTKNAGQLSYELKEFIKKINSGQYYNKKKISAKKVDIIAHSMGGVVTRYYIESKMYDWNIRKLIMMGTPNHGAWDPKILSYPYWGRHEEALDQLTPGSDFLNALNDHTPRAGIDYYTIAGTGWSTHVGFDKLSTWRGDGVVPVDSVMIPGVPIYCTWNTHAEKIYTIKFFYNSAREHLDPSKEVWLTESEEAYNIFKDLILKGTSKTIADCNKEYMPEPKKTLVVARYEERYGRLKSPATLHVYDSAGNHIGPDKKGNIENTFGDIASYTSNIEGIHGQFIKITGKGDINFVIKGNGEGIIGFEFAGVTADGNIEEKSFENIRIDAKTQYVLDTSKDTLELVKEELKPEKAKLPIYMPIIAAAAIVFGVIIILKSKKKK